jgi:hypothetical protein
MSVEARRKKPGADQSSLWLQVCSDHLGRLNSAYHLRPQPLVERTEVIATCQREGSTHHDYARVEHQAEGNERCRERIDRIPDHPFRRWITLRRQLDYLPGGHRLGAPAADA